MKIEVNRMGDTGELETQELEVGQSVRIEERAQHQLDLRHKDDPIGRIEDFLFVFGAAGHVSPYVLVRVGGPSFSEVVQFDPKDIELIEGGE